MAREQVGTAPTNNPDAATKNYVDAAVAANSVAAVLDGGSVESTTLDTIDGGTP